MDPAENLLFTESTWTYGGSFSYTDGESKLKMEEVVKTGLLRGHYMLLEQVKWRIR